MWPARPNTRHIQHGRPCAFNHDLNLVRALPFARRGLLFDRLMIGLQVVEGATIVFEALFNPFIRSLAHHPTS